MDFVNLFSLKPGRIVIMLAGRYAGKKAIVLKAVEEPSKVQI
jgi:ribosomal protein L14E/L6E/L27E